MKQLLEAINRGILKALNENNNMNLLTDLDDDKADLINPLLTKSINNIVDYSIKQLLSDAILTGKLHSSLKQFINDPNNFSKLKGLIKANDKDHLKELIKIGLKLFGNEGNFNWIDTSGITDMSRLFYNSYFNGHIELWDVSKVTDMKLMFYNADKFNLPIGGWDVSHVIDMLGMFCSSKKFNLPIGDWNVSSVTSMHGMFLKAGEFNLPIGNWDVSKVLYMPFMFCEAYAFNLPINNWDIRNVTNITDIFAECPIKEKYKPQFTNI